MKKHILEFLHRGLIALGFGPIVLAVVYLILQSCGVMSVITVNEMCIGILSLSFLAFIAGGMNFVYGIERLPLMVAILIHGAVLYIGYLATYLLNGWLDGGMTPILVFSGIFVVGYFVIWVVVCSIVKRKTSRLNEMLKRKQQISE